jgi:methylenetetrahydrofolate dehydrogenase (NADP+)/methenyltetrahydrofolate cyclohydrolase
MSATVLDGRKLSAEIRAELVERVASLVARGITPTLAGVLVGEDAGSASYVRLKEKGCNEVGVKPEMVRLPQDYTQKDLLTRVRQLSALNDVHGIFIQLPLPPQFDENAILDAVAPEKDVDGFHAVSVGRSWLGREAFVPATPAGIMRMLQRYGYTDLRHKHAVVVGVDNLVGKPIASLLAQESVGANVTLCHPDTPNLVDLTHQADILVVSVNRPAFIKADMVKDGVIAFDFGANYVDDPSASNGYRLVGDIDFEPVSQRAEAITPVPGGLGPMTVTMLLYHTVQAAERLSSRV